MIKNIFSKLVFAAVVLFTFGSCDLALQKDYEYNASVADPHIDMTAWEFLTGRSDLFSRMTEAVEYVGLKDLYTQTGSKFTYLALTNAAMNNFLGGAGVDIQTFDKTKLTNMLLYHIVDGEYSSYGQLQIEPMFVLTKLRGEEGLMTMHVSKNPWQADAGKIYVNQSNGNSPSRKAVSSNIMPTNGVIHVFEDYCYYKR